MAQNAQLDKYKEIQTKVTKVKLKGIKDKEKTSKAAREKIVIATIYVIVTRCQAHAKRLATIDSCNLQRKHTNSELTSQQQKWEPHGKWYLMRIKRK